MLRFEIIGNLGADAQVKSENGREFVSFNVGHNERWRDAQGVEHESTMWVSCALSGNGGNLLPFLQRGRCVYVCGRGSARVYSSEKARGYVAGLNISVDRLELVGANPDPVPRSLAAEGGELLSVSRAFYISQDAVKALGVKEGQRGLLLAADGREFEVDSLGFVVPKSEPNDVH